MADLNFPVGPADQQLYNFAGKTWKYLTSESRWSFVYGPGYGITSLNSLTNSLQTFSIGTSGTGFSIISSGNNHEFRLPIAGAGSTGLITTLAQTIAGAKTFTSDLLINSTTDTLFRGSGALVVWGGVGISGNAAIGGSIIFTNNSNTNIFAIRAGVTGANVTYTLPITAPTVNQILAATTVSGTNITLGWTSDQTGSGGLASLNGETVSTQVFATSTLGTDFTITSSSGTHTFNIPIAGSGSTGLITTLAQTIAGAKTFTSNIIGDLSGTATSAIRAGVLDLLGVSANTTYYLTGTTSSSANNSSIQYTSGSGVSYDSTSITATTFRGNATTAGTATSAIRAGVLDLLGVSANTTYYLTGTTSSGANNSSIQYTSGSGVSYDSTSITATTFRGNATSSTTAGTATSAIRAGVLDLLGVSANTTYYLTGSTSSGANNSSIQYTSGSGVSYDSTSITAATFRGNATTAGTATSAIRAGVLDLLGVSANTTYYLTGTTSSGANNSSIQYTSGSGVSYDSTSITATTFRGNATSSTTAGTATSAIRAGVLDLLGVSANTTYYLTGSTSSGANNSSIQYTSGSGVSYDSTSITATTFRGNAVRVGNAARTVDTSAGNLILDSFGGQVDINDNVVISGNLTVQGSTITVDSTISTIVDPVIVLGSGIAGTHSSLDNNMDRGIEFKWVNGSGVATTGFFGFSDSDGRFRFIPDAAITSSNVYAGTAGTAVFTQVLTTLAGNAAGVAATYTNFYGTLLGNATSSTTAGTATSAIRAGVLDLLGVSANTTYYLTGSTSSGANNSSIQYTSGSGVSYDSTSITATTFRGNATSSTTAGTATSAIRAGVLDLLGVSANTTYYLTGTTSSGANNSSIQYTSGSGVSYDSTSITAATFRGNVFGNVTGNLTGTVTGTATTAQNTYLAAGGTDADHYLTFSRFGTSTSGIALSSTNASSELTYNPVSKQLKLPYITGTAITATHFGTWAGSTITSFYGGTGNRTYTKGDLLVGGLGSTLMVLPKGPSDRYLLRVDSTNNSVGLGWTTFAGTFVTSIAPASSLIEGDLWYKVDDGSFNVYYIDEDNTAQWVEIVGGSGAASVAAAGSASEVQFNNAGVLDGDVGLTYSTANPTLSIKGFPVDALTGCALQILGPGKTQVVTTGTFIGINSANAYAGNFIQIENNDTLKFQVASDGATYIATLGTNGAVYSNSGTLTNSNPSDQNLKQNIQAMIGGTVFVNELNPVSFEWKSEANGTGTKYGFIAQEVQQVIPEIVSTDSTGTIGLDTVSMIPFLVKAIKEQQEVINTLKVEIQNIKSELGI